MATSMFNGFRQRSRYNLGWPDWADEPGRTEAGMMLCIWHTSAEDPGEHEIHVLCSVEGLVIKDYNC